MEHLTTFFSPLLLALGSKVYGKGFKPWDLGTIGARYTLWVGSQWRTTWRRRNQAYQAGHAAIALSTNSLEAVFVFLFTTIVMSASRAALSLIESAIKKHNVVVFSKTTCPFSVLAKRILSEAGVEEMKVYEIEQRQDGAEIQSALQVMTGRRTVPNVFIKGTSIGGGSETAELYQSGRLKELLQEQGIVE